MGQVRGAWGVFGASSLVAAAAFGLLAGTLVYADAPTTIELRKALRSDDPAEVKRVLGALAGHLDRSSVRMVLDQAPNLRPLHVYDDMVATLATAKGDALDELQRSYKKQRASEMRFLVVDALGKSPEPAAEEVVVTALSTDREEPVQVLAARLLGRRKTKTAVEALIAHLEKLEKDPSRTRMIREVNGALGALTGQDIAVAEDWKNYWQAHQDKFAGGQAGGGAAEGGAAPDATTGARDVMERMRRERPAEATTMTRMREDDIVVLRGNDECERVLRALKLPHTVHPREALDTLELDAARQLVILNCPGAYDYSDAAVARVRAFVAQGGYLFASDWTLKKLLAKAFPEAITFLGETERGGNREVSISLVPAAASHPLLRDVFPLSAWAERSMTWNLHERSHLAKEHPALTPLIQCADLKRYGTTHVAFTFAFTAEQGGRPLTGIPRHKLKSASGVVLWVSSHFKDQQDEKGDGFALQQLLLNFILEKQDDRRSAER